MKHVVVLLAAVLCVPCALAQAWVPERGEGYFTFTFGYGNVGDHYFSETPIELRTIFDEAGLAGVDSDKVDVGTIRSRTTVLGGGYAFADRWAVDATAAYVASSYSGPVPENPAIDDGKTRGDLQDASVRVRWQALDGAVKLAPFIGLVVPLSDYENLGHAANGRNLTEYSAGVSVGRGVGSGAPSGFVQASYFYTYPHKFAGRRTDRSNLLMEFGYFLTHRVTTRLNINLQETHGGIDWATELGDPDHFHAHDVSADTDHRALGGSVFVEATPDVDVMLAYQKIVSGDNSHELSTWTAGIVYSFGNRDRLIINTLPSGKP